MRKILLVSIILLAAVLRLYALDKYPYGLNADEAAIGYNAYSLLLTGHDEHGTTWPLVFRSFDDYKPPVYFYLVLPFVKFLGLNVWAVRLPSALLGTLSVYLTYLLTRMIFKKNIPSPAKERVQGEVYIAILASLLLAVSPWHLHFSRGGWEVNTATTFLLLGLVLFFKTLDKPKFFIPCVLSLVTSLYTYHSMRLIIPLLCLSLLVLFFKKINFKSKSLVFSAIFGFVLLLPLAVQMLSPSGQSRFTGVSVFSDSGPLWEALELRRDHTWPLPTLFHNRYLSYGIRIAKNYLSHYSPRFLFVTGDEIDRSRVPGMGQMLLVSLPFICLGLFRLLNRPNKPTLFLLSWLVVAPLAASITFQSPHALRAQNMSIPLAIITAYGLFVFAKQLSTINYQLFTFICVLFTAAFLYDFSRYLHQYYIHYPKELPIAWQGGFDQLISYIQPIQQKYDRIVISDSYDQPYIITAFFLRYPPEEFQKEIILEPRDKFGFSTVRHFGKFYFKHTEGLDFSTPNSLVVTTTESAPTSAIHIKDILAPGGHILFSVYQTSL